jgi:hypothetical protein
MSVADPHHVKAGVEFELSRAKVLGDPQYLGARRERWRGVELLDHAALAVIQVLQTNLDARHSMLRIVSCNTVVIGSVAWWF